MLIGRMSRIATTDAMETPTVTVFNAPRVDCPNSDCSSQNVLLVTCTANSEPAPAASAISTGSSPMTGATGARMPADVIAEMVTEPTATCSAAAIAHTTSSGAAVLAVSYLLPLAYLGWSLFRGARASANPWGATGLEWSIPSPPTTFNFDTDPIVTENAYDYVSRGKQQSGEV